MAQTVTTQVWWWHFAHLTALLNGLQFFTNLLLL
jgi:hypothetical protein